MSDAPKRRLPVLPAGDHDHDAPEERPPWQWSAIGAGAVFLVWLPLAELAARAAVLVAGSPPPAGAASTRQRAALIALSTLAFALAAFAGGLTVGRFGGTAGRREATLAGLAAGTLAWVLAVVQPVPGPGALGWALVLVAIDALGGSAAYAGGRAGLALRRRPEAPDPRQSIP